MAHSSPASTVGGKLFEGPSTSNTPTTELKLSMMDFLLVFFSVATLQPLPDTHVPCNQPCDVPCIRHAACLFPDPGDQAPVQHRAMPYNYHATRILTCHTRPCPVPIPAFLVPFSSPAHPWSTPTLLVSTPMHHTSSATLLAYKPLTRLPMLDTAYASLPPFPCL